MDRNFPGVPRFKAMLETGTHVLIRVRDGITLRQMGLPARRLLPGGDLRRRDHAGRPGHRVHRHRCRPGRPRAVVPHHRPARPPGLPGADAGQRLPLAVDRLGNLPEGSHVRHHRRRAVHRAYASLLLTGPGRPRARRLGNRHRTGLRPRRRRRGDRYPRPLGTPRRAAGAPAGDLLHRRPPGRHRLRLVRPPPACPPPSPRRTATPSWSAWSGAASRWTGTATARPRPGRASRSAGRG